MENFKQLITLLYVQLPKNKMVLASTLITQEIFNTKSFVFADLYCNYGSFSDTLQNNVSLDFEKQKDTQIFSNNVKKIQDTLGAEELYSLYNNLIALITTSSFYDNSINQCSYDEELKEVFPKVFSEIKSFQSQYEYATKNNVNLLNKINDIINNLVNSKD